MGWNWQADTSRIEHAGTAKDTTSIGMTIGGWFFPTDSTNRQYMYGGDAITNDFEIQLRSDLAGKPLDAFCGASTTSLILTANTTNFATWAFNTWVFKVMRWVLGGANSTAQLWVGNMLSPPIQPSAYTTQQAPVGTPSVGNTVFRIGNGVTTTRE